MSWLKILDHGRERRPGDGRPEGPPTFPTASTFFGMAVALILLWLLAGGYSHLFGTSDQSVSHGNIEAGASK